MSRRQSSSDSEKPSRREFLQRTGTATAATALAGVVTPNVHAGEDNTIRLALIGCGGRGGGAVSNAMNSAHGPVKLVAMADVVENRLNSAHKALSDRFGDRMDVPKERQFIGFDAYKHAIDCLGPNDVAMLTNFAYFRPSQLEYAVNKGVNVFMEKSFAPDAPGLRRLMRAGEEAEKNIHQIDEICWLKDDWPVTAQGIGGRTANSTNRGQGFDSISIEWTFPDGTKATDGVRWLGGHCFSEFATFAHGTKCAAQFSGNIDAGTTRIYKDQRIAKDNIVWDAPEERYSPWDAEWNVLLDSIRNDKPQNEVKRAAMSNFADLMGRAAVHSGKIITWNEMFNSKFQFVENIDDMDYDTEPPVKPGPDGYYPVPIPGVWSET